MRPRTSSPDGSGTTGPTWPGTVFQHGDCDPALKAWQLRMNAWGYEFDGTGCYGEQTRRAMDSIKLILDHVGASFRDVVKVTKYLTDIRDFDGMHAAMAPYFAGWRPASTTLCVNQLSSPGARVEIDMIVALPKGA